VNTATSHPDWYRIQNAFAVPSPALVFHPSRIAENVRRMIRMAGEPERLRPHVKTHKTPEIVAIQLRSGIRAFKCATIAEAEMTAAAGAADVLLAMQPVGPAIDRVLALQRAFPACTFGVLVDCESVARAVGARAAAEGAVVRVWLDVNSGMNRTGIVPGPDAYRLYRTIHDTPGLVAAGLHVYDGHIHDRELEARTATCDHEYAAVDSLAHDIRRADLPLPEIVAGGTPTFPVHARRAGVRLSPGTPVLWDAGYSAGYPDLEFLHAAVLLSRVVSKPSGGLVCLDLGTKALASEMPQPRVVLLDLPPYRIVAHNEEHLVIETDAAPQFAPGDVVYGIPIHICPTVARYETASIAEDGRCTGEWRITARDRRISV